ncbi:peptidyl-tRNA hydrolase [Infirmifilum lucidum]|uniref:Peptidyl-tRNA hydrolase n=1 Tax=Infirmifilum lucidum TaxID=2776706 RepID=A0A7L9FKZ2_9CREN|nr:peptidyl-tRNA hydrolase Pth2 [Infirmifilum lucidum]QOJ79693.1 peptidyl-tRNA hydrolase [Infirmifilum lucidum]
MEEIKQVIVIRRDLEMGRGKMVAQGAHASLSAFLEAEKSNPEWVRRWLESGQKKIVVRVDSLEELIRVYNEARNAGLPVALVTDMGLTQLEPGTVTAVGIGPAPSSLIDPITRHLKLL